MMTRTNVSSLFCAALLLVSADAFCPNAMPSRSIVRAASPDSNTPPDAASQATTVSNGFARFFAFSAAASIFAFQPMATLAAPMDVGPVCKYTRTHTHTQVIRASLSCLHCSHYISYRNDALSFLSLTHSVLTFTYILASFFSTLCFFICPDCRGHQNA